MGNDQNHRQSERKPVTMGARCRTMSGLRDEGQVSDLSTHGCCLTMKSMFLAIGTRVMIKPDGLEAISGVIRWLAGNRAGVQFDAPLYGPVFNHLSQQHATGHKVDVSGGRF